MNDITRTNSVCPAPSVRLLYAFGDLPKTSLTEVEQCRHQIASTTKLESEIITISSFWGNINTCTMEFSVGGNFCNSIPKRQQIKFCVSNIGSCIIPICTLAHVYNFVFVIFADFSYLQKMEKHRKYPLNSYTDWLVCLYCHDLQ